MTPTVTIALDTYESIRRELEDIREKYKKVSEDAINFLIHDPRHTSELFTYAINQMGIDYPNSSKIVVERLHNKVKGIKKYMVTVETIE